MPFSFLTLYFPLLQSALLESANGLSSDFFFTVLIFPYILSDAPLFLRNLVRRTFVLEVLTPSTVENVGVGEGDPPPPRVFFLERGFPHRGFQGLWIRSTVSAGVSTSPLSSRPLFFCRPSFPRGYISCSIPEPFFLSSVPPPFWFVVDPSPGYLHTKYQFFFFCLHPVTPFSSFGDPPLRHY